MIPAAHTPLLLVYTLAQGLAASALLKKLRLQKTAAGVSYQTLLAFTIGHICAFVFSFMLPPSISTLAYAVACLFSAGCLGILVRVAFCNFPTSYQAQSDSFGRRLFTAEVADLSVLEAASPAREKAGTESWTSVIKLHWLVLYAQAIALVICIEFSRRHDMLNVFWSALGCFADCLLGLALLPQLSMMFRSEKTHVARAIGEAVVYWTAARAASLLFWYMERQLPGRGVKLVTEPLNLLGMAYIAYYYRLDKKQLTDLPI